MKTKEIVSYLHKQGVFLTEEQAKDIAFIVGEATHAVEPVPLTGASVIEKLHDILSEGGYVCCREPLDPSATFADLQMDSLDITRLVVECDNAFGIHLDIEGDYPKDIGDLVNLITEQLP